MKNLSNNFDRRTFIQTALFNILAFGFVFAIPYVSKYTGIPFYVIEPMRLAVILAIAHMNRWNAYILALVLPLFMFLTAMHPSVYKTLLLGLELLLNAGLFYFLVKKIKNAFFTMLISIVAGKMIYYGLKYLFIDIQLIEGPLVSTPIMYQLLTTFVYSGYIYLILRLRESRKSKEV
ncbi:MAG: hypothetical protein NT175_13230 [Bacteroidetes bacterium]|nr:hypothetical protein [Bacteroidota bacterium]